MTSTSVAPELKLELTSSPHVRYNWSTQKVMWMVLAALIPSVISALLFFGIYQFLIILVSVGFATATEAAIKSIRKKKITLMDGSAALTGLLLALILPPNFSLVSTALGAVFAVAVGKEIFGGLGFNIFNPALAGRAFLQAAFPVAMTTWEKPNFAVDAVTSATPLAAYKFDGVVAGMSGMFFGNIGGSIGETSAIAILIGGIFLIAVKIVNWRIPAAMTFGIILFGGIFWIFDPVNYPNPLFLLLAGGFLFGAFFMATDWVTSPLTAKGMWIFGLGISFVIVLIRLFGGLPEGVMYAILFMNAFVPMINRYTRPRVFGAAK